MSRRTSLITRALRLKCPNCGGAGVVKNWFTIRSHCPHCNISLSVSNPVGANLLNLVMAEVLLMILIASVIAATTPKIPWSFLQFGAPALMIIMPMILFPFSKMLFIAFDLSLYPGGKPDEKVHGVKSL